MNKKDLILMVSRVTCAKSEAVDSVNVVIQSIQKALQLEEKVVIQGLGAFSVHRRKARTARNPKTGESVEVGPRRAIHFKPSKILLNQLAYHD